MPAPCDAPRERTPVAGRSFAVDCAGGTGRTLRGPARLLFGLRIDPNQADVATLEVLPGIGPARAAAIVAERERAAFGSVRALERVPGIGPVTRAALAPWLEIRPRDAGATLQKNR